MAKSYFWASISERYRHPGRHSVRIKDFAFGEKVTSSPCFSTRPTNPTSRKDGIILFLVSRLYLLRFSMYWHTLAGEVSQSKANKTSLELKLQNNSHDLKDLKIEFENKSGQWKRLSFSMAFLFCVFLTKIDRSCPVFESILIETSCMMPILSPASLLLISFNLYDFVLNFLTFWKILMGSLQNQSTNLMHVTTYD